jgi:hypothetical protein
LHIGFHQLSTMLASVAAEDSIVTFTVSSWQRFFHLLGGAIHECTCSVADSEERSSEVTNLMFVLRRGKSFRLGTAASSTLSPGWDKPVSKGACV